MKFFHAVSNRLRLSTTAHSQEFRSHEACLLEINSSIHCKVWVLFWMCLYIKLTAGKYINIHLKKKRVGTGLSLRWRISKLHLQGSLNTILNTEMSLFVRSVVDLLVKSFQYSFCCVILSTRSLLCRNLGLIFDFLMMTASFSSLQGSQKLVFQTFSFACLHGSGIFHDMYWKVVTSVNVILGSVPYE